MNYSKNIVQTLILAAPFMLPMSASATGHSVKLFFHCSSGEGAGIKVDEHKYESINASSRVFSVDFKLTKQEEDENKQFPSTAFNLYSDENISIYRQIMRDFADAAKAEQPGRFMKSQNFTCSYYNSLYLAQKAESMLEDYAENSNENYEREYERHRDDPNRARTVVVVRPIHWPPPNYIPGK